MTFSRLLSQTEVMFRKAAVFALPAVAVLSQTASLPGGMTRREWDRLRKAARTPDDYRRLSQWCEAKAALYLQKQKAFEADLRKYNGETTHAEARYPHREQTLRLLIEHSRNISQHWRELANLYASKSLR
jgi:hypothetical protein